MARTKRERRARRKQGADRRAAQRRELSDPIDALQRLGRAWFETPDPVLVEFAVSGTLADLRADAADDLGEQATMFDRLIADAGAVGGRAGLALLVGLAALVDEPRAREARAGVMRLRTAGVEDPPWASAIGRFAFVSGWSGSDEYGDQEVVVAEFADETGAHHHAVTMMVDANFDGLIRQAALADSAARVREVWDSEAPGVLTIADRTAQFVADRLAQGLEMLDTYLDPPVDPEVYEIEALLAARLRLLPKPRAPQRRPMSERARLEVLNEFSRAKESGRSRHVPDLTRYFVDYKCDFADGDPLRWSPIVVELFLLDWFPRKVIDDAATRRRIPDALRRWVRFAGHKKGLRRELVDETLAAVDQFEDEFHEAAADASRAGPAKALATAMLDGGVDLANRAAVDRWIADFNARPIEERNEIFDLDDAPASSEAARRALAAPPMLGELDGIDLSLLDPADPDDRLMLIEAEHPELRAALDEHVNIVQPDGTEMNPRLHIVLHEIVVNRLWDGRPAEDWAQAQRLTREGLPRHDVLHRLMGGVSDEVFAAMRDERSRER